MGYITILSTSTIVHTVSRCIVARSCAIGTASTVWARSAPEDLPSQPLGPGGRGALTDPDGDHAGGEQQHVAALDVLVPPAVDARRAGEARVVGVDQLGELGLALPGRHRQRGDRHPVVHPDAGVAGEEQVGQRVDEEVVGGQQAGHQAVAAADLVVADPRRQEQRQLLGALVVQRLRQVGPQRVAEVQAGHRAGDRVLAGVRALQRLGEQVGQVEHLDVTVAQRLGEGVVLVLGAADPRDPVEEQLVVVAGREPLQLRTRPVQHHRSESADLAVGPVAVRRTLVRHSRKRSARAPTAAQSARTQAWWWSSRRERRLGGGRVGANARLEGGITCVRADSAGSRRAFAPTRRGSAGAGQAWTTSTRVMTARIRQTAEPM